MSNRTAENYGRRWARISLSRGSVLSREYFPCSSLCFIITPSIKTVEYCDELSVTLPSVRSYISKTTRWNFMKYAVHVTCSRSSVLFWRRCTTLRTSGFVDDVMFAHNRPGNGDASRVRLCDSPGGITGARAKSGVYDCRVSMLRARLICMPLIFFTYLQPTCNHYCENLFLWGQVLPFPLPLLPILLLYSPPVHMHSR